MDINPNAVNLNNILKSSNSHILEMLSETGKALFFPKGILSQSAEAKQKAYLFNATIGMATEKGKTMSLPSIVEQLGILTPEEALTYAPSYGVKHLRELWKKSEYNKNPSLAGKEISLPVVTNAITHGLSVTADMWLNPDDILVIPDKLWGNYNLIFQLQHKVKMETFSLFDNNFKLNIHAFEETLVKASKVQDKVAVLLNFPNNPTGYTPTTKEADEIADVIEKVAKTGTNIIVMIDDAYFGLVFEDGILRESIFSKIHGRHPRILCIKLDGATKEDYVWGLRVGFITYGALWNCKDPQTAYNALEQKTGAAVRGTISNACRLSQEIVYKAMTSLAYSEEKQSKYEIMKSRLLEVKRVLSNPIFKDAWDAYPFNSGYFMCIRLKNELDGEKFRLHLLEKYGVGVIALGGHDIRIAFSCLDIEQTKKFFEIMLKAVNEIK